MSMRFRTKTADRFKLTPLKYSYWAYPSGTFMYSETYDDSYVPYYKEMYDVVTNPLGYNPCQHLVIENDAPWQGRAPKAYHPTHRRFVEAEPTSHQSALPQRWITMRPDIDFAVAMDELERNARGDMSTSVNMVVNLAEVAELKSLAKGICSSFRKLYRHFRISNPELRRALKGRKRRGQKSILPSLKDLANGHLAYSFGIAPLVKDISAFLSTSELIRKRREELRARSGRVTRLSSRVVTTDTLKEEKDASGNRNDWPTVSQKFDHWCKGVGVLSAACCATYNLDNPSTRWKLVSQSLGLTTPLTSIWNLIPFSFVADWFFPIGKAISKCERAGLNMVDEAAVTTDYLLFDFQYSEKWETVSYLEVYVKETVVTAWQQLLLHKQTQRTREYWRSMGKPALSYQWFAGSTDWSITRSALTTSLSIQRIGRTPKPPPKKWPSLEQIYTKAQHVRKKR